VPKSKLKRQSPISRKEDQITLPPNPFIGIDAPKSGAMACNTVDVSNEGVSNQAFLEKASHR
jgi:hypothetical protein